MDSPNTTAGTPKAVAVIDIGSNSVRMMVAQVFADGRVDVLERVQRAVRLGHDTFVSGRLSQPTMNAAISILRDCARILATYKVEQVRAVATSAVREASNADAFINRIAMATTLDVDVIDTAEEMRLTLSAVRKAVAEAPAVMKDDTLIVEVGGGSALLAAFHLGQLKESESYSLGSIRLQEALSTAQEPPERAVDLLRHEIANIVAAIRRSLHLAKVRAFIAIGGDARFAARRIGKPGPTPDLHTVDVKDFDALVIECSQFTADQLRKQYGLAFADAETLVPALLAYQALLHATRAARMTVCNVSMRDGLLMDLARVASGKSDPELAESVIQSARAVGEKYRYDSRHAEHVTYLAARLFDDLQRVHALTPRHRLLLQVAALLHEIGEFVSSRAHHKHSYYLISNAEIFGLRRDELLVVANVARYHRRGTPKPTHINYISMPREQRIVINKLAAILRLADALDVGHEQRIDFSIERRPTELILSVRGPGDLALERRAVDSKSDLFEEIYGMKVRLEEAPGIIEPPEAAE